MHAEYVLVSTVEQAKELFGPISLAERQWRSAQYFEPLLKSARAKLGVGEHDRAEAYIFGDGPFPESDVSAHRSHFPVSVKVLHAADLFLGPGETMDLSAVPTEFPWDTGDSEIYVILNVQRLFLGRHSTLRVNGNVFILNCQELLADSMGDGYVSIEVGASHEVQQRSFLRAKSMDSTRHHGADGTSGANGEPPTLESTPLGVRVVHDGMACPGGVGADGATGSKGHQGRNGAMLYLADLRFGRLTGFGRHSIHIKAQAGAGFDGGPGGNGGHGGPGGAGSDGLVTAFGIVPAHEGGPGGRGGAGGDGGKGGNGGLSCDQFVSAPAKHVQAFLPRAFTSQGGTGGPGGKGGPGGTGGPSGRIGAHRTGPPDVTTHQDPSDGPSGADGSDGQRGLDGKTREAPRIHIFPRT